MATANLPATVDVAVEPGPDVTSVIDPGQITLILRNLLSNASQAMDGTGTVWLAAERAGAQTRIRVRDGGPGLAPQLRERIFEALFTTKAKGNGLGLALCRRIAEAHGGTIVCEPTETGAAFLLTLPDGTEPERIG